MARTEFMIGSFDDGELDLDSLNLSRLLARLEQNILSSSADLKLLRQSRYHRARVGAVRCAAAPLHRHKQDRFCLL